MRKKIFILLLTLLLPTTAFAGRWNQTDGGSYGAIAYSPSTGKTAWSYGYTSFASATIAAVNVCGVGDCTWLVAEKNQYAVLAVGSGGPAVAWNADLDTAQTDALSSCNAKGTDCQVLRWVYR
jgi:hypothetical protein